MDSTFLHYERNFCHQKTVLLKLQKTRLIYIFERLGTEWHQKTKLVPSDGTTNFNFGLGTAIDGEKAVVGSGGHSINGGTSGAIYIF